MLSLERSAAPSLLEILLAACNPASNIAFGDISCGSSQDEGARCAIPEGGPDDHGAWELVATPLQQFRLRSFRDPKSQTFIGCLCLSSYADEWASVAVRYDGKGEKLDLVVNGKVCCQADKSTEPSWSDAALRQSTLVHLGMVPGSVRPGAAAEVHAVQLWESALTDPDLDHLVAHFSHVMAWSKAAEGVPMISSPTKEASQAWQRAGLSAMRGRAASLSSSSSTRGSVSCAALRLARGPKAV
ncbi:unnamed protein product, partial [Symbiodinium necroappetens]